MANREYQPLTVEQLQALHADLHPARVAHRSQGNQNLSYMEAYDIKAMLIRVFGYGGFSADCLDARILREVEVPQANQRPDEPNPRTNWQITAQATVRITIPQTGVTYTETAVATNSQPQYGEAADTAMKSAESDALKRAAIYLGTQFGLSLYRNGQTADIVRRVFAPEQAQITQDVVLARQPEADPVAEAARQRLQERLKVHAKPEPRPDLQPVDEHSIETPAEEPQEPPQEPAKAKAAPKARRTTKKATSSRQEAAQQALANAESAVGLRNGEDTP